MTGHPEDEKIRFFTGTYHLFPAELLVARPVVELDLGCGAGSFTAELVRRYPERTVLAADCASWSSVATALSFATSKSAARKRAIWWH